MGESWPGLTPQGIAAAVIVAGKFGLPLLIIRYPFAAAWANLVLDSVDGDLLIPLGVPDALYQPIDKIADWVTYIAMVIAAYRAGWPIRRLVDARVHTEAAHVFEPDEWEPWRDHRTPLHEGFGDEAVEGGLERPRDSRGDRPRGGESPDHAQDRAGGAEQMPMQRLGRADRQRAEAGADRGEAGEEGPRPDPLPPVPDPPAEVRHAGDREARFEAGAEAAKLEKFSDAGGPQIQWLSDAGRIKVCGRVTYMTRIAQPSLHLLIDLQPFDLSGKFLASLIRQVLP